MLQQQPLTQLWKEKECFNCGKNSHFIKDCWKPGGGKEGHGSKSRQRHGSANKVFTFKVIS